MSRSSGQADFGVWGLGVMGANLALNVADHGFTVAVWNRSAEKVDELLAANGGLGLLGCSTPAAFVAALEPPRRILLMVPAGGPVDESIETLVPLLTGGDILIDGGNSHYLDTRRREAALREKRIAFVGCGVSGGEDGARHGPSLMPGGDAVAYARIAPVLEAIAARSSSGACVTHVGPDGAGHFVKMVHNGIEYGDMQLIAEAYDLLRRGLGLAAPELAEVFEAWNRGPLESFLVELAARVFRVRDRRTGRPLVDVVLDAASQKGTGRWTVQAALELGVPVPTLAAAVDARTISSAKAARVAAAERMPGPAAALVTDPQSEDGDGWIDAIHDALHASKICSYAQGLQLVAAANGPLGWAIDCGELARIWTGGCIIRARLLDEIRHAFQREPALANLALDPDFATTLQQCQPRWRQVVAAAAQHGIPVPAMAASLSWFDGIRSAELPQNLTQAQRDAFGAHTFVRRDAPTAGAVHADWTPGAES